MEVNASLSPASCVWSISWDINASYYGSLYQVIASSWLPNMSWISYYMGNRQSCKRNMRCLAKDIIFESSLNRSTIFCIIQIPFQNACDRLFKPRLQARQRVCAFACSARILKDLESWQLALKPAHARPYFLMISSIWPGCTGGLRHAGCCQYPRRHISLFHH